MDVAIAGGGIGGLSAALCLSAKGHRVSVFDKSLVLGDVGAGLQVSPNARRVLDALGVGDDFSAVATEPRQIVVRRWRDDAELRVTSLGDRYSARFGCAYANVARPDLINVLWDALRRAENVTVETGTKVTGASTSSDGRAQLHFADGADIDADLVVGADGIHSMVRSSLWGVDSARFSGSVAYRALIPRERVAYLPIEVTNRLGPDAHVVTYFVGPAQTHLNVVCVVAEPNWDLESWTEPGDADQLRAHFADWSDGLRKILDCVDDGVFRWALYDRPPLTQWGRGAVTLLGDSCHPMLPFMAQGACQAIEDAAVLARCLDDVAAGSSVEQSLQRYELLRRERTARVQQLSWTNRTTYHLLDGPEQEQRDAQFALPAAGTSLNWLYGYDPLGNSA